MKEEKVKSRKCARCGKSFKPTIERKLTCKTCYGQNSHIPPMSEEPNLALTKKQQPTDDIFFRIHSSPTNTR